LRDCLALRFDYCGARDIVDFFPICCESSRVGKKSFIQIKDRSSILRFPLNPARKLCSRLTLSGRSQLFNTIRTISALSISRRHLGSLDLFILSEHLALGKLASALDFSLALSHYIILSKSVRFCNLHRRPHAAQRYVGSIDFSFIPNFTSLCNSPPAVIAATLSSLNGL
jgi:hypothetical protein